MKKTVKKLIAGLLIFMLCFAMASCDFIFGTSNGSNSGENEDKPASSYVAIDINPSIELTVSDDGTVVSVYGANEDGQVLLYEEEANIVNKDIETAIAYITELAKKLGYLNENNSDVSTTVLAKTEAAAEALKSKVDAKIVSSAEGMGLAVSINAEAAFALLCELEELKALYPDNTAIQNLTPDKYKLAISASNGGDITIEAAAEMSNEALIAEINKAHKTLESYATDAYLEAKARAIAMFESSMGVICDGVYTKIYTERAASILANPSYINTIHYGAMYQAYKTSARTYLAVLDIMKFADEYTNYELDEATVAEIKTALSIADDSQLRDEDGKITLGSVSDFCNKFIDENEVSEDVKASVKEILAEAKDAAELVVMASGAYETELTTLKNAIQSVISNVTTVSSTILPLLPADAKAEFEACLADLNATSAKMADIMENGDTSDAVIILAAEAQKKADEVLEKIENDLTDAEKAKAEAILTGIEAQIKALTSEFEGRLSVAETQAKQYIENKRQERLNTK
ncbi:MAG: hypothetical protein E7676_07235 [Ruminococcaceae bacterium]|nr:hypothetical protein [Oscillospiraceae bacterium]